MLGEGDDDPERGLEVVHVHEEGGVVLATEHIVALEKKRPILKHVDSVVEPGTGAVTFWLVEQEPEPKLDIKLCIWFPSFQIFFIHNLQ